MAKRRAMVPADQEDRVAKAEEGEVVYFGTKDGLAGQTNTRVGPKCDMNNGRWWCVTHSESFANQFQKDIHIQSNKHRLSWVCFQHGLEVP